MRHPIETLWREVGLPEYFLGNDGSNVRLYALYDAIIGNSHAELVKALEEIAALNITPNAAASTAMLMRRRAEEALARLPIPAVRREG